MDSPGMREDRAGVAKSSTLPHGRRGRTRICPVSDSIRATKPTGRRPVRRQTTDGAMVTKLAVFVLGTTCNGRERENRETKRDGTCNPPISLLFAHHCQPIPFGVSFTVANLLFLPSLCSFSSLQNTEQRYFSCIIPLI